MGFYPPFGFGYLLGEVVANVYCWGGGIGSLLASDISNRKIRHYTVNFVCAPRNSLCGLQFAYDGVVVGVGSATSGCTRSVEVDSRVEWRADCSCRSACGVIASRNGEVD